MATWEKLTIFCVCKTLLSFPGCLSSIFPCGVKKQIPDITITIFAISLAVLSPSEAAQSIVETFDGPSLNSGLELSVAGSYTLAGGQAFNNSSPLRQYIRTVATDFRSADFTLLITYTVANNSASGGAAFIGIGGGMPDAGFYEEPLAALYFRHLPTDFASGIVNPSINNGSGGVSELSSLGNPGSGTHRAQLFKLGNTITYGIQQNYTTGNFFADYSATFDLTESRFSFLNDTNSRLFFGGDNIQTKFDNVTIAVPEPSSALLIGLGGLGFLARRRRNS
jgi:hypothetical protein